MKKLFTSALVLGMLTMASLVSAEHDDKDPYDAMCQSTGIFRAANYTLLDAAKNDNTYYQVQLYGHCGEQPNLLEIDKVKLLNRSASQPATALHKVEFWQSPKRNGGPYWRLVYAKEYYTNPEGQVLKSQKLGNHDDENFLMVESQSIMDMVITQYVSAKKGGPIFPSALAPIQCDRGEVEENLILEIAYMDYLKKK